MKRCHRSTTLGLSFLSIAALLVPACARPTVRVVVEPTQKPVRVAKPTSSAPISVTDANRYLSHIALLAHDELGGRGTGSDGIDIAAGYIAGQFAAAGLEPGGPNGTYFQEFSVSSRAKIKDETELTFSGTDAKAARGDDFTPFGFSAQGTFEGDLAYVGYGIVNPDKSHDDYAGVDVTGRTVLMLRREPKSWSDEGGTDHARFDNKVKLAKEKGAVAVLVANQDPGEDGIDGLMRFRSSGDDYGLPALHIKRALADTLLAAGGLDSLTDLQRKADEEGKTASAPLRDVRVAGTVAYGQDEELARNVIGVLPGTGPNADEYVVIGGHYDHLGTTRNGINNGADDNASGTAGVIELGRAFDQVPHRNRSIIFMAFSGEERGLLGSRHYVSEPTVDLGKVVAMINMDMIGRLTLNENANMLAIQGLGTGDSFQRIVDRRAQEAGIPFLPDASAKGPSDHSSFYDGGVPALFFFTGVHSDYHQPGDDTEKINAEGAVKIVNLVYQIASDLVADDPAPQFAEVNERAEIFRGDAPGRGPGGRGGVVMGIMPDMQDESEAPGWRVAQVTNGGGADKAGMLAGDRILTIDGQAINDFADYRQVTRDKKPGDSVDIVVRRGGDKLTLKVELSARGG